MLATLLFGDELAVSHIEMIKGIEGMGYHDRLVVPIIDNTARECDLADALGEAIEAYPGTHAVLVRRHGVYVWGRHQWVTAVLGDTGVSMSERSVWYLPSSGCAAIACMKPKRGSSRSCPGAPG